MEVLRHTKREYHLSIELPNNILKVRAQINREIGSAKIQAFNPMSNSYHRNVSKSLGKFTENEYQAIQRLMLSASAMVVRMGLVEL